ncbi:MAG: hypothetical protein WCH99_14725 [Verrucomicrobiota bacterium]
MKQLPLFLQCCCSIFPWIFLLVFLALTTGCLLIPTDYHDVGVRHNINEKTPDLFKLAMSIKEEVFLKLGEPDFASEDGRQIGYAWTKVKALLIVASPGGGGVAEFKRSYVLQVSFDDCDRVSNFKLIKEWGESVSPANILKVEFETNAPTRISL